MLFGEIVFPNTNMATESQDFINFVRQEIKNNPAATFTTIQQVCVELFTTEYVEKHQHLISVHLERHQMLLHPTTDLSLATFSAGCMVCDNVVVRGRVSFGAGTIVQPCAQFLATGAGRIVIGSDNIFEEQCIVVNDTDEDMVIGSMNLFEVGCKIKATRIGNGNQIGVRASVGWGVVMGDHGLVVALQTVHDDAVLNDHCLVTPSVVSTADRGDHIVVHRQHMLDCLSALRNPSSRTCLLNFHKMHK